MLTRKSTYAVLLGFLCLAMIVRYPRVPHGVGVDAYLFSMLSSLIVEQGRAAWLIHPLSPFGLYPLSYPSGSFFVTADFVMLSGLAVEPATLLLSQFVGSLGIVTSFLMAREISRNHSFAYAVALVFALMPKFVTNTLWEVPARGLLMSLTPLFIWAVIRGIRVRRPVDGAALATVALIMLMSHRLALIVFVVFFAFVVALIFVVAAQIMRRKFPGKFLSPSFRRLSRNLSLPFYAGVLVLVLVGSGVLEAYQRGAYFSSDVPFGAVGNLLVSISRSVGILSPLAFVGIAVAARARNKSPAEYLVLTAPLALIPTLFLRDYTGYYLVTFFSLFIGLGIAFLLVKLPISARQGGAIGIVALVTVSAWSAVGLELPRQSYMTEAQYSTGIYARYRIDGTLASNDGLLAVRVGSISGKPMLPIGGATTAMYGPEALAFGFVREFSVMAVPLSELTINSDSMVVPIGVTVGADWSVMFSLYLDSGSFRIAERYDVRFVLEDSRQPGVYYTGWGVVYDSPLLFDIYRNRYKVYEGSGMRIWAVF